MSARYLRHWLLALSAALAIALAVACGGGNSSPQGEAGGLRVVTSVSPITSIVENIACARASVLGVIPEGQDSHTYEPPASVARELERADLIILNGLFLEEPLLDMAESNKRPDAEIVLLGDQAITQDQWKFDFSFPREQGKPNPHLWPSARLTMRYAEIVKDALARKDPANASYYEANYRAFRQRLEELDRAMAQAVATVPPQNRKLLTYHDSWAYWADDYGFQVIGAIQPSSFNEPSAQEVARIIDQIRQERVPAIFGSEVYPSPVLNQIARETGARYVTDLSDDDLPGDPGDRLHSYVGMMVENMKAMIPALGGDASAMDRVDTGLVCSDGSRATY